jgi:prefoldin subunit 5
MTDQALNYLRVYVKGTARRAIEYLKVSGDNYPKAIEALQKRYGRKHLVVEHLVESLLNIEKKDKVEARSLRNLYDVMVSQY